MGEVLIILASFLICGTRPGIVRLWVGREAFRGV